MDYRDYIEEQVEAGDVLLDFIKNVGIISESKSNIIEQAVGMEMLFEQEEDETPAARCNRLKSEIGGTTRTQYAFCMTNAKGEQRAFLVEWKDFWTVYSNLRYLANKDIMIALGLPSDFINYSTNAKDKIAPIIEHFQKNYGTSHYIPDNSPRGARHELTDITKYKNLEEVPTKEVKNGLLQPDWDKIADDHDGVDRETLRQRALDEAEPNKDDIYYGRQTKDSSPTGKVIDKLNKEELFPGEFYSNMSRIPRSSLFNWLRLWKKDTVGLKAEQSGSVLTGFLYRKWKKVFILGYQVDTNFLYEVWFNTIDSTYTIHDHRGGEMTGRVKSMAEAMRGLFLQLAKSSPKDIEFLHNPVDKRVYDSFLRAMRNDVDSRTDAMMKREKREEARRRKEAYDKIKADEKRKEEWRKRLVATKQKVSKTADKAISYGMTTGANIASSQQTARALELVKAARDRTHDWAKEQNQATFGAGSNFGGEFTEDDYGTAHKKDVHHMTMKSIKRRGDEAVRRREAEEARQQERKDRIERRRQEAMQRHKERVTGYMKQTAKAFKDGYDEGRERVVNENYSDIDREQMSADAFIQAISGEVDTPSYNNRISKFVSEAERETINFKRLQEKLSSILVKYTDSTRLGRYSSSIFDRILFSGRKDKVQIPMTKPSIFSRIKNFVRGVSYRADFVAGYSIDDRIDFEIWYVTEPNPTYDPIRDPVRAISSFYAYDLASRTLMRKYIPYYRNAEHTVLQKISTIAE